MQVTRTFSFDHPITDIVLGIGQVANPVYRKEEAKLWLLFSVRDFNVIDHFETHSSSQYGTYFGNSEDNTFYAVQSNQGKKKRSINYGLTSQSYRNHFSPGNRRKIDILSGKNIPRNKRQTEAGCPRTDGFNVQLQSYHYDLYGNEGDDKFFLGPQHSRVTGGEDNDVYYIPSSGGKATINNFAPDEEMDTLFLNVSYASIFCSRDNWDLVIGYCQTHSVRIRNWFSHALEEFHRHIYITTADGVVVEVTKTEIDDSVNHLVKCAAVSMDKSKNPSGEVIRLTGSFSEVKQVIGTNYSDHIYGNEKPNILNGGLGTDHLEGKNGTDTYIVEYGSGITVIDNFAEDRQEDLLIFNVPYEEISVRRENSHLVLYNSMNSVHTTSKFLNWFNGEMWQHIMFASRDHIRFMVKEDGFGILRKHPFIIDLSENQGGVFLNLLSPNTSRNISVDLDVAMEVKTVLDSPHNDFVVGNALNNFLGCSGGSDHLAGNGGRDTYVIDEKCNSATINNTDPAEEVDSLLVKCPNSSIILLQSSSNLIMRCIIGNKTLNVTFMLWFNSTHSQHLMVKTSDKISAFLPETLSELRLSQGRLLPFQVESDEDCNGESRLVNLTTPQYHKCERFVAKSDACSYSIIGNSLNNYLDPGPDNPYGYQHLTGGNGTDTYVMRHNYGLFNIIDNYAEDDQVDHLLFDVLFRYIHVSLHRRNVLLQSLSSDDSVEVELENYFAGERYQHLLVHSADGVLFKLIPDYPYIQTVMMDYSKSSFSQVIKVNANPATATARVIIGSKIAENHIHGGMNTTKIVGGLKNDTIFGGPSDENLIGLDGNDFIDGGPGNDVLYGGDGDDILHGGLGDDIFYAGMGADVINGTSGSDTIIFSGYNFTGVIVDMRMGHGLNADAEGDSYYAISNVIGSEYDDMIIGNNEDNVIQGQGGDDFIVPEGGHDLLQGGRGADIYYLTDASGHKAINNFATDNVTDLIVLNNTLWENVCYHFLGTELQINVDFDLYNSSEAFSRLLANTGFLMVTLPLWTENDTYKHVVFSFLDEFKTQEDFTEENHQLQPAIEMVANGSFVEVVSHSLNSIHLRFNYDMSSYSEFDELSFRLVHAQPNNVTYLSLPLTSSTNHVVVRTGLNPGTIQHFSMSLSSCGLTVAMSPLVSNSTLPTVPASVRVTERFFNGFKIQWEAPNNDTDPFTLDYQYLVKISSTDSSQNYEFKTAEEVITVYNLSQTTQYSVTLCSEINSITHCSTPIVASTTSTSCSSWLNLPAHLKIYEYSTPTVALTECESGYHLVGNNRVSCNSATSQLPHCRIIRCNFPSALQAYATASSGSIQPGGNVMWNCVRDHWVKHEVNGFQSTCQEDGSWFPPTKNCSMKPTCPPLISPQHGSLQSKGHVLDDVATYQCNPRFSLSGPALKKCVWDGNDTAYWSPSNSTVCNEYDTCPSLLPQPNGRYSQVKEHYFQGDTVELVCNESYYIQDDPASPHRVQLECLGKKWSPSQQHCQSNLNITAIEETVTFVKSLVQYTIPSLRNTRVPHTAIDPIMVCRDSVGVYVRHALAGEHITCYRQLFLTHNPTPYEGLLTVSTGSGNQKVCIKSTRVASTACSALGYGGYSVLVYQSAVPRSTTLSDSPPSLSESVISANKDCRHRIRCRASCNELPIPSGNTCLRSYENNQCFIRCNLGYALIGSSTLTCNSQGQWSGSIPRCDGE